MPTHRALSLSAAALTVSLALTACGGTLDLGDDTADDTGFTFGLLYPQTGNLSFLGRPQTAAVDYAIDQINDAGGILGTTVPPPVVADEAGDAAQANQAANDLVSADVNAVIGAAASVMTQASYATITGAGIAQCSGSSTAPDLTSVDDNGYFFRTAPSDLLAGPVLAQRIVDDGHLDVAVIARADDYGNGYLNAVEAELHALGADVVLTETYDPDATNFGAVISSTVTSGADAVALISFQEGTQLMAALIESGTESQFYLTDGLNDPDLEATIGAASTNAITGTTGVAPSADNPQFSEDLRAFDPELDAFQFAPHIFDCVTTIALAAESAGSTDPTRYVDHVAEVTRPEGTECSSFAECRDLLNDGRSIDYQGMSGNIDLDDNGDPTSATFEIFHFGDDGYEILEYVEYTND
ncbi:ABC transporter substrate-binding protein [Nocardiopsis sp. B62]|uniref:ABC transporter substrate-binding protein n=1 Tax=Nocardiopsis sp. B62 TaxID=2824874 RepID=UPI001B35E026|nr:ABC transporter substrate-binding protein [Nocardiopsis sp. B62]MBQ1082746.1 ABC transporter substrate-binding protein [Nocardiopsis sp. B62]